MLWGKAKLTSSIFFWTLGNNRVSCTPKNVYILCQGGCDNQSRRFLLQPAGIGCWWQFCWNTCHLCWVFEAEPSEDQGQAVDADDQVWGRKRGIGGPLQETVGITPPVWGNFAFDSLCLWVGFHNMWYAYKLKLSYTLFHSRTMWTSVTMDFCSTLLCPRAWRSTSNFSSSRG